LTINQDRDSRSEEVQMYGHTSDDYGAEFSKHPTFDFDRRLSESLGCVDYLHHHGFNPAMDNANLYYEAPDVNTPNQRYSFANMRICDPFDVIPGARPILNEGKDGLPLVRLGSTPYRFLLAEDGVNYNEFSRRYASSYNADVRTYDFRTQSVSTLNTKINSDYMYAGSNDQYYDDSGLRGATYNAVDDLTSSGTRTQPVGAGVTYEVSMARRTIIQ
jgi:hypothetical protein